MQTKEELQSTVSSLQEKLEQAEKSTLKESQEKASMLKELRQRIHDLESSFEKERSGAAAKVAILENMLHGMKQSMYFFNLYVYVTVTVLTVAKTIVDVGCYGDMVP